MFVGLLSGQEYADLFGSQEISRLGIGRFIKNLVDVIQEQIDTPSLEKHMKPKMYLYSGHDNTLSPLLNAFKVHRINLQILKPETNASRRCLIISIRIWVRLLFGNYGDIRARIDASSSLFITTTKSSRVDAIAHFVQ